MLAVVFAGTVVDVVAGAVGAVDVIDVVVVVLALLESLVFCLFALLWGFPPKSMSTESAKVIMISIGFSESTFEHY